MKRCLADVNVLFALLVRHHEHHERALLWFDSLEAGEAVLCRVVQLGLIRLLGNSAVMGEHAVSAAAAWTLIAELLEDERIAMEAEPAGLDTVLPKLLLYPSPTNKLLADAYLAAFSLVSQTRLVTFDQGFRQFRGLDLLLLSSRETA